MKDFMEQVSAIAIAIAGVAVVAVLVSKKSQTPQVIQASGSAYSNALAVAVSPVTGAQYRIDLSYPQETGGIGGLPPLPQLGTIGGLYG